MQTHFPNSELALLDQVCTATTTTSSSCSDSEKAWHILSLLLSLGRPTQLLELASSCTLFHATPHLIKFLASIPNSPITLSSINGYVTISQLGQFAVTRLASNSNLVDSFASWIEKAVCGPGLSREDSMRCYFRKRYRIGVDRTDGDTSDLEVSKFSKRIRTASAKVNLHFTEDRRRNMPLQFSCPVLTPDLFVKPVYTKLNHGSGCFGSIENKMVSNLILEKKEWNRITACEVDEVFDAPSRISEVQAPCQEGKTDDYDFKGRTNINTALRWSLYPLESASVNGACQDYNECQAVEAECREVKFLVDCDEMKKVQPRNLGVLGVPGNDYEKVNKMGVVDVKLETNDVENQATISPAALSVGQTQRQLYKPSARKKITYGDVMDPREQTPCQLSELKKVKSPKEKVQRKRTQLKTEMEHKLKQKHDHTLTKEGKKDAVSSLPKDKVEVKDFPCFDSYIVEEEEGSGGYGIVYRARRKDDGTTVAIKCPHENAHRHHVINELRMLERFGGKNFIIKFEGQFKHGTSECFVLEHVEHDRPEVLKKEIDVFELRWYGYCLFRALAALHKQGIVHKDVKPGNFLFSRKANKGYLIDFNLAMDLHQKYVTTSKLKAGNVAGASSSAPTNITHVPPVKSRRFPTAKPLDTVNQEDAKRLKSILDTKNVKRRAINHIKVHNDMDGRNIRKSQGADSGITSVKDATTTKNHSGERLREPLPCKGRKELISLLQDAMQNPNIEALSVPASMRKRIAAPLGNSDGRHIYLSPMPVHSTSIPAATTSLFKNKAEGKQKKEGPCAGTKGFRAPEVLLRSPHQGPKVDIWSAGVTFLYLMTGRTPFYGDPEQNLKDIAKLRGSEDLWEVSKLHDRESSFPMELYDTQSLASTTLLEWCQTNTKRQDFLKRIPNSLIDLVDKCLTVNPRLRISAEDALKHEFFAPCHEALRKQRLHRQALSSDPGAASRPLNDQKTASSQTILPPMNSI